MPMSVASRALLVPINNGNTIVGISDVPLPYLFLSTSSVHILVGLLGSLAIFSLLVTYQLHHKHNHDGLAQKLAAIAGSPFTLAGAIVMSSRQLLANETSAPSGGDVGSLLGSPERPTDQEQTIFATIPTKQEMMERLGHYTYALDWSGNVMRDS